MTMAGLNTREESCQLDLSLDPALKDKTMLLLSNWLGHSALHL